MTLLPHIAGRVFDAPLLIARAKLDTILGVLAPRLRGETLPFGAKPTMRDYEVQNGIAVIPVVGTLVRRTVGLEAQSGLTSYGLIAERLDAALSDNAVKGILLDIDSPGGEAGGVFDLADKIFTGRAQGQTDLGGRQRRSLFRRLRHRGCRRQNLPFPHGRRRLRRRHSRASRPEHGRGGCGAEIHRRVRWRT
jgi:hypothetical protein